MLSLGVQSYKDENTYTAYRKAMLKKFLEQLTGLAFRRKSRIQPENKYETHVDNGRVNGVRAVDTLRLKEFVS